MLAFVLGVTRASSVFVALRALSFRPSRVSLGFIFEGSTSLPSRPSIVGSSALCRPVPYSIAIIASVVGIGPSVGLVGLALLSSEFDHDSFALELGVVQIFDRIDCVEMVLEVLVILRRNRSPF